jgi:hypothetical protein
MFSRRQMLAVSAAGVTVSTSSVRAASFGNPDEPPQGEINARGPGRTIIKPTKQKLVPDPVLSFVRRDFGSAPTANSGATAASRFFVGLAGQEIANGHQQKTREPEWSDTGGQPD